MQGNRYFDDMNDRSSISPYAQFTQRLINEFNADEAVWRKLAWKRRLHRLLRPKMSRKKRRQMDLADFAVSQPPKECVGFWRI
jgi:hypothetical protein